MYICRWNSNEPKGSVRAGRSRTSLSIPIPSDHKCVRCSVQQPYRLDRRESRSYQPAIRTAFVLAILQVIAIFLPPTLSGSSHTHSLKAVFISNGKKIHLEERCGTLTSAKPAAVIFLHGSGGPESSNLPYVDEEDDLAKQGICVFIPHYLDSTGGLADNPQEQYSIWVQVVEDTATYIYNNREIAKDRIALVGYSLGASVALGAAAKNPSFAAIVEFSGSLPDQYVASLKTLPPLFIIHGRDDPFIPIINAIQLAELCNIKKLTCRSQLYMGEGHFLSLAAIIRSKREVEQFLHDYLPVK